MIRMFEYFRPKPEDLQRRRSGPLAPYLDNFAAVLARQGYCRKTGWLKVRLVMNLSQWLAKRGMKAEELAEEQVRAFFKSRKRKRRLATGDLFTLKCVLRQMREANVIPTPRPVQAKGCLSIVERDYEQFLLNERGLAPVTVKQYFAGVRRFLAKRFGKQKVYLNRLRAQDVTDFILKDSSTRGRRSLQLAASALRSFLTFLFQRGLIPVELALAVPRIACYHRSELPRYLEASNVERILSCCDRRQTLGIRDYAILLLLARLGLRAGEIVRLRLEDIDWRAGELRIHGKGARMDRLPLIKDVGQAVADYLQKGRPICASRHLFIRCKAPHEPLTSPGISEVVQRALGHAQLHHQHQGAHLLRHSLATRMIRNGASLAQIGQVLRHQHAKTTEVYAKVDLTTLRRLAQPWVGGAK